MFFGLFRKSNVLDPATRFDPAKHLCRSDIIVHSWGLEVIKWSKTLQFRERNVSIPLPYIKGHPLCPTTAVVHAFSLTSAVPLLWPALTLSGVQPLRYPQFVKMLCQFLKDIGLPAQMFAGHSFRRGGASFAMQAGLLGEIINICNWGSGHLMLIFSISKFPSLSKLLVYKNLPRPCLGGNVHYTFLCGTRISGSSLGLNFALCPLYSLFDYFNLVGLWRCF